jgi:Fic family protein
VKSFANDLLLRQPLSLSLLATVRVLGEFKGKEQLWQEQSPQILAALRDLAVIQSTESSNRIEGVTEAPERLRQLMRDKTKPADRSEQEIAGYRDVLATIHASHAHVPVTANVIRQLHRDLYKFTPQPGGNWKPTDNQITETRADGTTAVRFQCVVASLTPQYVDDLCAAFNRLRDAAALDPLLLIPAFVFDFLCIHPFRDGNGRMARLLTLLLLYQSGYEVGRYISLERVIEQSKESYYEALAASSKGWHEARHDLSPWRDYLLGTLIAAYREFESRVGLVTTARGAKTAMVVNAIEHGPPEFTISDIERACPMVGRDLIRRVLNGLRTEGKLEGIGKGRSARWRRK